jgi:hypothetical protein
MNMQDEIKQNTRAADPEVVEPAAPPLSPATRAKHRSAAPAIDSAKLIADLRFDLQSHIQGTAKTITKLNTRIAELEIELASLAKSRIEPAPPAPIESAPIVAVVRKKPGPKPKPAVEAATPKAKAYSWKSQYQKVKGGNYKIKK